MFKYKVVYCLDHPVFSSFNKSTKYEKQVKLNQTLYQIMLALDDDNRTPEFYRKLDEIKEIADIKA